MKISQRQARRDQRRLAQVDEILRRQKNRWSSDWIPGWVNIESLTLTSESFAKISTARALGHAVIMVPSGRGTEVSIYAERL